MMYFIKNTINTYPNNRFSQKSHNNNTQISI